MLTINDEANKAIAKAKREINKAIEALAQERAYEDPRDIFHNSTVEQFNTLCTASQMLLDD